MPTMPAIDLRELLKDIPRGAWVAISSDNERVITYGSDMRAVLEEARRMGEAEPLITRIPESSASQML